jgi:hypothetical protein
MVKLTQEKQKYNLFNKEFSNTLNSLINDMDNAVKSYEEEQKENFAADIEEKVKEMSSKLDVASLVDKGQKEKPLQLISSLNLSLPREMVSHITQFELDEKLDPKEDPAKAKEQEIFFKEIKEMRNNELSKRLEQKKKIEINTNKLKILVEKSKGIKKDLKENHFHAKEKKSDHETIKKYKILAMLISILMIGFSLLNIDFIQNFIPILKDILPDSVLEGFFVLIIFLYLLILVSVLAPELIEKVSSGIQYILKLVKSLLDDCSEDNGGKEPLISSTLGINPGVIRFSLLSIIVILFLYISVAVKNAPPESVDFYNTESLLVCLVFILGYYGFPEEILPSFLKSPRKIMDPSVKNLGSIFGSDFKKKVDEFDKKITTILDSSKQSVMNLKNEVTGRTGDFIKDIEKLRNNLTENALSLAELLKIFQEKEDKNRENNCISKTNQVFLNILFIGTLSVLFVVSFFKAELEKILQISVSDFLYTIIGLTIGLIVLKMIINGLVVKKNRKKGIQNLFVGVIYKISDYITFYNELIEDSMREIEKLNEKSSTKLDELYQEIEKVEKNYNTFVNEFNVLSVFPPHVLAVILLIGIGFGFTVVFYFENLIQPILLMLEICVAGYFVRKQKKSDSKDVTEGLTLE